MIIQAPAFMRGRTTTPPVPSPLLTGLIAYWKLEGNANDATGQSAAGIASGGVSWPSEKIGLGAQFTPPARIDVTLTPAVPTGNAPRSIAAWVRPESVPWGSNVLGYGTQAVGHCYDFFQDQPASGQTRIGLHTYGNTGYEANSGPIPVGGLSLIVFTYDGTTVRGYANGVLFSTWTVTLNTDSSTFKLGAGTWTPRDDYFTGALDEVGFWDRELSEQEVLMLFNRRAGTTYPFLGVPTPNTLESKLTGYWPLNGNAETKIGSLVATLDGDVTFSAGLFSELAADFTGVSAPSINLGQLAPFGTGDFTMACWATLDSPLPFYARWFCLADGGPSFFCDPAGVAGLAYSNTVAANLGHTVTLGAPTHYAVSVSQSGGSTTIRPYINGVATTPTTIATPGWNTATVGTIGTRYGRTEIFPGRVQRAAYWRQALSAGQILDVYNGATYPFA